MNFNISGGLAGEQDGIDSPSAAQEGIWLGHQRAKDPSIYNAAQLILLEPSAQSDLLLKAIRKTLEEAEALHINFVESDSHEPIIVRRNGSRTVGVEAYPASLALSTALALAQERTQRVFDLATQPLFYHEVMRLDDGRIAWLHVAHHILLDGYGFNLIARRISEHYGAELKESRPSTSGFTGLSPVLAQNLEYQGSHQRAVDLEFWQNEQEGIPGLVWGNAHEPARGVRVGQQLSVDLVRGLDSRAKAAGLGWIDLALASIARVCGDLSGQHEFSLGMPVMLRLGTAALRTPCMAMNIVPLRVETKSPQSRLQLAQQLRATQGRQRAHQRFRYEHLQREAAAQPLFGTVVNVMPFDFPLSFAGSRAELVEISAGPVMDLSFSLVVRDGLWTLSVDGHPRLFSRDDLAKVLRLVEGELNDEVLNLSPSVVQSQEGVSTPLSTACDLTLSACPLENLGAMALGASSRVAFQWRERSLTYRELNHAVNGCARALTQAGVIPKTLVAVDLERGPLAAVVLLALSKIGAAYVAIDPAHPEARRQVVFERANPGVWVRRLAKGRGVDPQDMRLFECSEDALEAWTKESVLFPLKSGNMGETAYVTFTSGSSGEPKGVVTSFGALRHFVAAALQRYRIVASDRVLAFAPLTFDTSVEELFVSVAAGATLVFRREEMLDSIDDFLGECARLDLSVLDLPTSYFHEIALAVSQRDFKLPICLRTVIIGGEVAQPDRVRQFCTWAPGVRLINTYGPSEATVVATSADLSLDTLLEDVAPIGTPLAGVNASILDSSGARIEKIGQVGELALAGPMLADGYLGRSDLTHERFITLTDGQRAYRTGDLVSLGATGQLYFRGRADNELKISGTRIAPAEVEATIREHELIRHAVVWGQTGAGKSLHLCAAVEVTSPLELSDLKAFVRKRLPSAMVPTSWKLAERFPLTSSGKIDRVRIQREAEDASSSTKLADDASAAQGADSILSQILDAWSEVLGVSHIEVDQNFFDLGGTSLHLIQLANRLSQFASEQEKAPTIRVAELFKRATPISQAEWLEPRALSESSVVSESDGIFVPTVVPLVLRQKARALVSHTGAPAILLTGATGFLGIYLLDSLLQRSQDIVACLVRATGESEGWTRIEAQAHAYGLDFSAMRERVVVVSVSDPDATLPELKSNFTTMNRIVHCAAQVSLTRDYESLLASNVKLTRDLLEWAGDMGAEFHFVSTIATLPDAEVEECFHANHRGLRDGYQQSKAHAEWLCQSAAEQGLKVAVYRLGRVVGARRLPQVNANDLVWRIARSSVRVGLWPDVKVSEPWAPVDELADSLVDLSLKESATSPGSVFHLVQHGSVELDQVRQALLSVGIPLRPVSISEWMSAVGAKADQEDLATLAFFEMRGSGSAEVSSVLPSCERTRARLGSFDYAPVDQSFIVRLCESARAHGITSFDPTSESPQKAL